MYLTKYTLFHVYHLFIFEEYLVRDDTRDSSPMRSTSAYQMDWYCFYGSGESCYSINHQILRLYGYSIIHSLLLPNVNQKIHHFTKRNRLGESFVTSKQTIIGCIPMYSGFKQLLWMFHRLFILYPFLSNPVPEKKTMIYEIRRIAASTRSIMHLS